MDEITVMLKPDSISWNDIHDLLWTAHAKNRKAGMHMRAPSLPGEKMREMVADGKCFVALDGEKLVGTCSFKMAVHPNWFNKGQKTAYCMLEGVLPEYQGRGIYSSLIKTRDEHIIQAGADLMEMNTAEKNTVVLHSLKKNGWRYVDFTCYKDSHHYSVVMAKWIKGCPFSRWKCWWMFNVTRIKVKLKYKPGRVRRLAI